MSMQLISWSSMVGKYERELDTIENPARANNWIVDCCKEPDGIPSLRRLGRWDLGRLGPLERSPAKHVRVPVWHTLPPPSRRTRSSTVSLSQSVAIEDTRSRL